MHHVFGRGRAFPVTSFESVVCVHFYPAYLAPPAIWVFHAEAPHPLEGNPERIRRVSEKFAQRVLAGTRDVTNIEIGTAPDHEFNQNFIERLNSGLAVFAH